MTIQETKWAVDPTHSKIGFKVKHLMISNVSGNFREFEGEVSTVGNDFSKSVISLSMNTASVDTEIAERDAHLKSGDFFDVENYPKITFVGSGLTWNAALETGGVLVGEEVKINCDVQLVKKGNNHFLPQSTREL